MTDVDPGLLTLREPFPAHQISQLPKGGVMLDYVGHAALTDRLLDADPRWTWEPLSLDSDGLPAFDRDAEGQPIGLWIRLTVCGVTRLGYGDAGGKKGANAIKEIIGDALRNAAMRFGAALDLWFKGDLHGDARQGDERQIVRSPAHPLQSHREKVTTAAKALGWGAVEMRQRFADSHDGAHLADADAATLIAWASELESMTPAMA